VQRNESVERIVHIIHLRDSWVVLWNNFTRFSRYKM